VVTKVDMIVLEILGSVQEMLDFCFHFGFGDAGVEIPETPYVNGARHRMLEREERRI
jgi:hypothetical protein